MEKVLDNDAAAFRILIEESLTPIALYAGREMHIQIANKAMIYDTWGKDTSVIGKTLQQALPELDNQPFHQLLDDVFTTGQAYHATEDLVKMEIDGQLQNFYYNFTYQPLLNAESEVWGILNTATNVTDLVLARRRADEAEENLNFALTAAGVGTWNLDIQQQLISWDANTRSYHGFQQKANISYSAVLKSIHPDDQLNVNAAINQALQPSSSGQYDTKFRTVDAEGKLLHWLHCKGKAYFDKSGTPYRFSGITQNISQQVQADEKMRSTEQLAQLALDNINAGTFLLDMATNQVSYTPVFARVLTGREDIGLTHQDFINHVHPDDHHIRDEAYNKAKQTGRLTYEARFIWHDQSVHWIRTVGNYIFDEHKQPLRFAGIAYDFTAEAEASHEQQKLLWLIDNSNDFISLSDWNGTLTFLNKAGLQMMGLDSLEDARRAQKEYVMPNEIEKLRTIINPTLLEHGRWAGRINYRNFKTGETIPAYATSLLLKNAAGQPLGRASIVRDLRPELKAEEEQMKLVSVVDNNFDGIAVVNIEGAVTYLNTKGREIIGYPTEPNVVPNAHEYFFQEDVPHNLQISEAINTHGYFAGKQRYRHLNTGAEVHTFAYATRLNDPVTGDMTGFSIVIRDLGPEIAAQQALQASEALFRGITTASPTALWMSNAQGHITYVNQIWVNWTGIPLELHLGSGWLSAVSNEDAEQAINKFTHDFLQQKYHESQFRIEHQDGTQRWISCTGNPQYDTAGHFTGYIGACVDITEQKQLQQQKDEFIGVASHELKTPVTSIKAYAQILEATFRKESDVKKTNMLAKMNNQIDRLTTLITDLLDVTKIQSGRLQLNNDYFSLNQLVTDLTEDLQRTTHHHQLVTELQSASEVYADKDRISQVITNLVTNAIKYSPQAEKIIIRTYTDNNALYLSVQDFGIGISADKKDRVFEQFYRVSGDKQHTFPGLGLGLYISAEIIKRAGGKIGVHSKEGEGSTFYFALPLKHE
ncbi:PAS domain S-box protein [Mucilaginibacter robiniae]|uniref:histidine kinase n=1 Tax=Mucilaginibacter robiniae TaxID=2728022 RepID=A0A7L5E3A2_9SPHI|nr:PAS domain S-box protein [Mucilaginibacter robiniae]QJD97048.1 PAS domain S-box protein [Mucilaginibacter robiniae]